MNSRPFRIKNLPYIPHIMNDSNGRFGDKKSEGCYMCCVARGDIGKEKHAMCFFTAVWNVFILLQISLIT